MRAELEAGATLQEVADYKGVSRQWISQQVGNLNRRLPPARTAESRRKEVARLVGEGLSDKQIAVAMDLSLDRVGQLRLDSGTRRPNPLKKHSCETILVWARWFYEHYGYAPTVTDCIPSQAARLGHYQRVERYYRDGAPSDATVRNYFGSWPEMIRQAGLPPAPMGSNSHGRFDIKRG